MRIDNIPYGARVGDIGTIIERTIYGGPDQDPNEVADVSGATVDLIVVRPDGSKKQFTMTPVNDGTDGKMEYKVTAEDNLWTMEGVYLSQCIVQWGSDNFATGETAWRVGRRRMIE